MRDGYVYYAQSKEHPGDPMYAKVNVRKYGLLADIHGLENEYFVFRFSPRDGSCKVISFDVQDT